ncbi:uncharacterized protein zgc:109986 isoform X4 [Triplophysa rosa]|uniref:uncharacterized protein zgc:109986 isoform X4 n=1 Tax=Triplophysa rosa TaxID=992332 RepID=UPI002545D5B1|nr:uncharacterized protein zgc:109986 isoform X4 [Triplophysa rosa]
MNFNDAKNEILQVLSKTDRQHLPKLLEWLKTSVHVDAFLYDEETVDSLCEDGKMSRNYCLDCASHRTAPLEFISHSFSIPELQFLFQNVLPDLTGKQVIDVGSRLGAVLYGGYLYGAAAQLVGIEINSEFVKLQTMTVEKYGFSERIQVIHADIRSQAALVQNADVLIMNNVFEYFMEPSDQMQAWQFISHNFRKKGALLVTVPSIQEAHAVLQENVVRSFTVIYLIHITCHVVCWLKNVFSNISSDFYYVFFSPWRCYRSASG